MSEFETLLEDIITDCFNEGKASVLKSIGLLSQDTLRIANCFLTRAEIEGLTLNCMKLNKLVFFAEGWHCAIYEKPLLKEPVVATLYGIYIESIYQAYKHRGNEPIKDFKHEFFKSELLDKIWKVYGRCSAIELANITHGTPNGAWERARDLGLNYIPFEYLKEEFVAKVRKPHEA